MIRNEVLDAFMRAGHPQLYRAAGLKQEQLETLLDAAVWAPSGGNNQSWLFTAIQNKDVLLKLNELVVREGFQHWVPDDDYPGKLGAKALRKRTATISTTTRRPSSLGLQKPNLKTRWPTARWALRTSFSRRSPSGWGSCYLNQLHWLRNDKGVRDFPL